MHTQNVNVKTATKEHSERYGEGQLEPWEKEGVRNPLAVKALLMEFVYLESMNESYAENGLSDDELEEALYEIFRRMTELAGGCSVVYMKDEVPKVDYEIIQYWVKAQRCVRAWFGDIGERAIAHARYRLALTLRVENSYV
ncbi:MULTISPECIES: dehydrogenase [Serratia]|uniref:dehydrogenase n=1 Tax=Serratia TaxID=613 RepID=UPI00235EE299|nr:MULTISPECIES: dehydrogenase [Serratia]